jgi:hypothetical protein
MATLPRQFSQNILSKAVNTAARSRTSNLSAALLIGAFMASPALAQQAGSIRGQVSTEVAGISVSGVTVTATSPAMPKPRSAVTREDGSYSLPLLKPGEYTLTFTSADGSVRQTKVQVLLEQTSNVDVAFEDAPTDGTEIITISGSRIIREGDSSLTNSLSQEVIAGLPVGQDYRDLLKLIPGVQYSENATLGPAAGGSGVDNKYGFDGVDVSLPLFGNLASEPSTHDILNVTMDRGGAKAIGFNRSGGFAINTTSKSGTNEFHGNVEYKLQNKNMVSDLKDGESFEDDKSWLTASLGGPLIEDELFFYASYYRPEVTRDNKETAYGSVKSYESIRNEYFGKLTWAPTDDLLFNISKRSSERTGKGLSIGEFSADTVSQGDKAEQDIFTLDGSWLLSGSTSVSFQYNTWANETGSQPDVILSNVIPRAGDSLDLNMLDQLGRLNVPDLISDPTTPEDLAFNAGAQVLIDRYGYINDAGQRTGGGSVGAYSGFNNQNFYRDTFQLALDHEFDSGGIYHQIHVGFKWSEIREELSRLSNGWGQISYVGGQTTVNDTPVFFETATEQMSLIDTNGNTVNFINSSAETYNFEINDTIEAGDFTYNVGVLISKDVLYGQGLKENSTNISGFEVAPGNKYKMYTMDWKDMIQPRLGVNWKYDGQNSVFANYATYNPEASSLARAASWDRNTQRTRYLQFDEAGDYLGLSGRGASSGKFFAEDMTPRSIKEFTVGSTQEVSEQLSLRGHIRHRKGSHFWEDVWNYARSREGDYGPNGGVPQHLRDLGDYIPNLADVRAEIGGSSYVIAEVDEGFTKYWEVSFEAEWQGDRTYLNASYVWSHYYGNFDQDNTTSVNDANTFIGSSYYNDDTGKYSWDNKEGTLSADKPHLLKVYGTYTTDWNANIGAYLLYQSGQAWEKWSAEYYGLPANSSYYTINAYAEPAGSRRTPSHWQLDLNYTQDFELTEIFTMKFRADLFNVFDKQTGYNYNPFDYSTTFGEARSFYSPRRLQLSVNVVF